MATACSGSTTRVVRIGETITVIDRVYNANDPDTLITDATLSWHVGTDSDSMLWVADYTHEGIVGWYVGAISSVVTGAFVRYENYEGYVQGSGGGLNGVYVSERFTLSAV